jgi:hypothetical protein
MSKKKITSGGEVSLTETGTLRATINGITQRLITELQEAELTPMEKLSFLKVLLPYSVGKLPTAMINYQMCSGQATSARVVELTKDGGRSGEWDIML